MLKDGITTAHAKRSPVHVGGFGSAEGSGDFAYVRGGGGAVLYL